MPTEVAAVDRAKWLAELADALEEAQKLTWRIGSTDGERSEAMELYGRLESARAEARSLQFGGFKAAQPQQNPNWTELLPWTQREPR